MFEIDLKQISQITGIREEILELALVMESKMKKNDHKDQLYLKNDFWTVLGGMESEMAETKEAMSIFLLAKESFEKNEIFPQEFSARKEELKKELADVANYCAMLFRKTSLEKSI